MLTRRIQVDQVYFLLHLKTQRWVCHPQTLDPDQMPVFPLSQVAEPCPFRLVPTYQQKMQTLQIIQLQAQVKSNGSWSALCAPRVESASLVQWETRQLVTFNQGNCGKDQTAFIFSNTNPDSNPNATEPIAQPLQIGQAYTIHQSVWSRYLDGSGKYLETVISRLNESDPLTQQFVLISGDSTFQCQASEEQCRESTQSEQTPIMYTCPVDFTKPCQDLSGQAVYFDLDECDQACVRGRYQCSGPPLFQCQVRFDRNLDPLTFDQCALLCDSHTLPSRTGSVSRSGSGNVETPSPFQVSQLFRWVAGLLTLCVLLTVVLLLFLSKRTTTN